MAGNEVKEEVRSMETFSSHAFTKEESHPIVKSIIQQLSGLKGIAEIFKIDLGERGGELVKLTGKLEDEVKKLSPQLTLKLNNTVQSLQMQSKALSVEEDVTAAVTYLQSSIVAQNIGGDIYDISSIKLNNVLRDARENEVSLSVRLSATTNSTDVKRRGLKSKSKTEAGENITSGYLRDLAAKVDALDSDTQDMLIEVLEIRDSIIQILRYVSYLRLVEDSGPEFAREARLSVVSYHAGKQALGETITNLSNDEQIAIRKEYEALNGMTRISDTTVDIGAYSSFSFRQPKGSDLSNIGGFYADNMLTSSDMRKYRLIPAGPDQIVTSRCSAFNEPMSAPVFEKDLEDVNNLLDLIKIMDVLVLTAIALTDNDAGSYGSNANDLLASLKSIGASLKEIEGNKQDDLDKKLGITIKDKNVSETAGVKAAISVRDDVKDSNAAKVLMNLGEMLNK